MKLMPASLSPRTSRFTRAIPLAVCLLFPASHYSVRADEAPALSTAPYVWRNVVMGGGGFVTGIITHPTQKDLMYARTDVGGAYRWDNAAKRWIPLTDWLGPADNDFMGIESIAVDPSDANRVYLAAGTYSRGRAAIFRSADQGRTFERTEVPFKMGGNENGRANGERLAVDPNQGEILFFGSRRDGLWKSADRGATWSKMAGFLANTTATPAPTAVSTNIRPRFGGGFGQQAVGVVCVLFDPASGQPGSPTPVIYAAVSAPETNFLRSADAGVTWETVANQPSGLCPNHIVRGPDGMLYLSYGREPGPNSMSDGAVWKFNPNNRSWHDITPIKPANSDQPFGYGAVAVDAQRPSTIVATTFAHWKPHDEVFRSTNGGTNWTALLANAEWDCTSAPYTKTRTPHWMGDVEINPFNSDQILFTTGFGLFRCINATDADTGRPTRWEFLDTGLEETVPLTLLSPPEGVHLLSGVGDIDGFRHEDLDVSPAQGTFVGPRYGNTEDLAGAAQHPGIIVRTGTGGNRGVHAAISEDGGKTWNPLSSEPPNSGGAGTIAISADAKIIVWTPRRSTPYFSLDRGKTWTACAGLSSSLAVTADPVNSARFYAFDSAAGKIFVSANGAANFSANSAQFPRVEGGSRFGGGGGARLCATPGVEGDLWLAFRANGLFHTTDSGDTCVKIAGVAQADSLGLGKAAPGKASPALFLAGRVNQLQALFRSIDAGATWQRINDDQHQYGYISRVTGDPRIFGRVYFATGGRGVIYGEPR